MGVGRPSDAAPLLVPGDRGRSEHVRVSAWSRLVDGGVSGPALLALVAVVYLALAQFVYWLNDPLLLGTGFWPAAGFSLALLIVLPRAAWAWVLGGVALAEVAGDVVHGYPVGAVAFWTAGDVVEPLVGAVLIRTLSPASARLKPFNALVGFVVLAVIAAPLVGGTIGAIGTVVFTGLAPEIAWPQYVTGDVLGILVAAPVLLTWRERVPNRSRGEATLLVVTATVATVLVFRNWNVSWQVTLPYLIVPFLAWAGLRFGLRGVALIGFVIANIANWFTATGNGPFAITGGTELAVTLLQVFLGITLISSFALAALGSDLLDSREMARREAEHHVAVQRSREFRDAFVGVLSHEIRTPIATLYGMIEVLRSHRQSMQPDEVDECVDDLGTEADRLRRLTEDLLVLSRTDGDRLEVARNPVALRPLAAAVIQRERNASPRHEIVLDVTGPVPPVLGEDGYIEQVLGNYLSNATKYSPPTSTVRVSMEPEGGGVAVRVVDAGLGLPAGAEDRVFDLFYRAPAAIANAGGAGVGLYVCRKLVEAMDGRVWAMSAPNGGTEFGFWLPAVELAADE